MAGQKLTAGPGAAAADRNIILDSETRLEGKEQEMDAVLIQAIGFVAMVFCIGSYQVKSGRGLILCKTAGEIGRAHV